MPSTAGSMSASSKTMTGALPPSSRCTRFRSLDGGLRDLHAGPHRSGDRDHLPGSGARSSRRPVSRSPVITFSTPAGRNSAATSASSRVDDGVVSDGFSTIVLPAAIAGANFHDRHVERVVPGRHLADHADRLAADDRGVVLQVLAGRAALEHARGAGEEADLVDREQDLVGDEAARGLPVSCDSSVGELVGALPPSRRRCGTGRAGARRASSRSRSRTRRRGRAVRRVDLLRGRSRPPCRRPSRRRVETRSRVRVARRVDVLAVDEVVQGGVRHGSHRTPGSRSRGRLIPSANRGRIRRNRL